MRTARLVAGTFCAVLLPLFSLTSAYACRGPQSETFLFFTKIPQSVPAGSFIGTIEIVKSEIDAVVPPATHLVARVVESSSHPKLAETSIALVYVEDSCGPKRSTWNLMDGTNPPVEQIKGQVIGRISRQNGEWTVSPFREKYGGGLVIRD